MKKTDPLFLRYRTWSVKKKVPKELQEAMKKTVIVISTRTRDRKEAERRQHEILAKIEQEFERYRNPEDPKLESFRDTVNWLREEQSTNTWQQELSPEEIADIALSQLYYRYSKGMDVFNIPPEHTKVIENLRQLAINPEVHQLKEAVQQYLGLKKGSVRASSLIEKEKHLIKFSEWIGPETLLTDIKAIDAGRFLTEFMYKQKTKTGEPLSVSTIKKHLSIHKAFFEWAESVGMIDRNPFEKTGNKLPRSTTGGSKIKVRAWNESDVITLLQAIKAKNHPKLASITWLAMYTGARGNELAELKVEDVTSWSLKIQRETKNENSQRNIPIHSRIKPLIVKLKESSYDGYLISGLTRVGVDKKRFHRLGNDFSEMKSNLGFPKRVKVFHSFRHTLVTRLRDAGETTAKIAGTIGHMQDDDFTLHQYADELESELAIEVIEKLDYRETANKLIDELIELTSN